MSSYILLVAVGVVCFFQVNGQIYADPRFEQQFYVEQYDDQDPHVRDYIIDEQPHIRARRQLFGGVNQFPGGRTQSVGYQAGPAWGSISQSSNDRGFSSPITYSAGAGHVSPAGHGISGRIDTQPGIGSHASARGQLGILNTPNHQVTGWAQHDRNFDKNFGRVGPETNSAGLNYLNKNNGGGAFISGSHTPGRPNTGVVAGAFISGSHTPGSPNTGVVGGNIPLATGNGGRTRLEAIGQTSFGQGMKPQHEVGVQFTHNF
ncbi:hypothetical protein ILUMI_21923 [Ignelater luminosus]|uniref:Uncharacterized protein n=1 Tax=Ignelater luminosus TaxID=2038154 RepID=A0A8K0CFG3_IGNLU|nr:hypothetical protein ILUMI_21923 [Ignelater luminosus]